MTGVQTCALPIYVTQKSIKGRAIADHLANCPPLEAEVTRDEFPDEDILVIEPVRWRMYFDGAANRNGSGIGVLLVSPMETYIPISINSIFQQLIMLLNMRLAYKVLRPLPVWVSNK